jgi:CPA1 family monovalent cation:H+ antiporter
MALFESLLLLLLFAIVSLQVSRRLRIPYPAMLAVAGIGVAMLPQAPQIALDPHLVMALFIAPAILNAAFDFPPRTLRLHWLPLLALAVVAVLLTTAAVAWVGVAYAGLPLAAAVALGAIVAPPDAAAAAAMLDRDGMPRATATVLKGESLLNDAVALLLFGAALRFVEAGDEALAVVPQIALAVPGGIVFGIVAGRIAAAVQPRLAGTLGGIVLQFVWTFATWILAERFGLSAILAVVAAAMTVAHHDRQSARDRVHAFVAWDFVVFVLNVLAFLFIGLEARTIVMALDGPQLRHAAAFAGLVLATVIGVRIVWTLTYNRLVQPVYRRLGREGPTWQQGVVAAWCGMRGMVSLGIALALPPSFPQRELVVLAALAVVLGTLVIQGVTLEPLIRWLRFPPDDSHGEALMRTRERLAAVAHDLLGERNDRASQVVRDELDEERREAHADPASLAEIDALRLDTIRARRAALEQLRRGGDIDDDVYRELQQELDLGEIAALRRKPFDLADG